MVLTGECSTIGFVDHPPVSGSSRSAMSQTIAIILRFRGEEADRFERLFEAEVYPLWEEFKTQGRFIAASLSPVVDGGEMREGIREYILHIEIPSPEAHDAFDSHPQFLKFLEKARPMQPEKPRVRLGETRFQI